MASAVEALSAESGGESGFEMDSDGPSLEDAIKMGNEALNKGAPAEEQPSAVEEAKPETPKEEPKAEPKKDEDDKLGSKFAQLHKKNKELFAREQKLKEQESKYKQLEDTLSNLKDDPAAFMEAAGFKDVREFVERLAEDGGKLSPERKALKEMQRQVEEMKADRQKEVEAKQQAESSQQRQQAVDKVNSDIVSFIKNNDTKYSLLSLEGGSHLVFQELQEHYNKTMDEDTGAGEVLPLEKAVAAVNSKVEANIRKIAGNPRVREILEEEFNKSKSIQPGAASPKQPIKTISGAVRNSSAPKAAERMKNDEELLAEATAFLKQQTHTRK